MGKNKPSKRLSARRVNPTTVSGEIDWKLDGDSECAPVVITNLLDQIQDASKEERSHGCHHMAQIVSQPKAVELLLKKDAIKITAPLFLDSCIDVQKGALGAMRNMSVYGEEKVCEIMVKNDVITPLSVVIKKYGEHFGSGQKVTKQDISSTILLEAVELLSNLCESNHRALQIFNKEGLLVVLLTLLNPDVCGYPLANAVAHCLHVVSENNVEVSRVCREPEVLSKLLGITSSPHSSIDGVLFKTRIIGVVLNLSEVDLSPYYDNFINIIGEVLDMDYLPLISLVVDGQEGTVENDQTDLDLSKQGVDKLIAAQRVSLEMVANLCCNDDDWEEMEDDGLEDSGEDVPECSGDVASLGEDMVDSLCLPSEIQGAFIRHDFLAKILKKAHPLEQSYVIKLEPLPVGQTILQRLEDLEARALLCFSNIISVLVDATQPQATPIGAIWVELYSLAKALQGKSEDLMWAVTSAMRSVLQKLAETDKQQISSVSQEDLEFMVHLGSVSANPETQINAVRMVSTIGCILALKPQHCHLVKTIGEILLQVCSANEDIAVVSETLDSLFDVFQEDETDSVAKQIDLVKRLKTIQSNFKSKVSRERKNLGQSYGIVMMARSNLAAFLKYKMARGL